MTGQSRHSRLVPPVNEQDHSRGPASAPVTLVEYGDYQCPYCGQAYPVIQKLLARMGSKVRFVFRNFPLQEIHPNAQMAAEAAEAAGAQGKFWEMHDRLYEHQKELKQENLIRHAGAIGLDVNRFKEELAEGTGPTLELVPNPDILQEISAERGARVVVGFAAESHDVVAAARRKIARKGCDLIVANDVSRSDAGFESDRNAVWFVWPGGDVEELPLLAKSEVARRLLDRVEKLRGERR